MASALLDSLLCGEPRSSGGANIWLDAARRDAFLALKRDGLPAARSESWKYTALRALKQRRFVAGDAGAEQRSIDHATFTLPGIDGPRLVFVNGSFRADLSDARDIAGLKVVTLADVIQGDAEPLRFFLARHWRDAAEPFARLNTALAGDGPVLRVAAGVHVEAPIHLVHVGAATDQPVAWHARALVELGEGASAKVIEHHVASSENEHLGNLVAQFALRPGAQLDLVQIQDAAAGASLFRRSEFDVADGACLALHTVELGAHLMRHDLRVNLGGRGASLKSRGVFAVRARQHTDTQLAIDHAARDTNSDVFWRGVADQHGRGVFHGAIRVAPGADGANARLSNKNLLLSPQAEIDTQPVLEIHADEVQASHGATVGQIDALALFYLRSRGLAHLEARALLTFAFCREALSGLAPEALLDHLAESLLVRLPHTPESS
ncbi:MAG: Fe-S cluster assembly protein SufD [Rhodanobacteraceae bacterium]